MSDRNDDGKNFQGIEVRGLDGTVYKAFPLSEHPEADRGFRESLEKSSDDEGFTQLFPLGGKPDAAAPDRETPPPAPEAPAAPEPVEGVHRNNFPTKPPSRRRKRRH